MSKVKRIISIGFTFILMLCMSISIIGCRKDKFQIAINTIKRETGIEIPEGTKLLYYYYEEGFHNGAYEKYFIFQLPNNIDNWLEKNGFLDEKNQENQAEFEKYFYSYVESSSFMKNLSAEDLPNFDTEYLFNWTKNKYLICNVSKNILTYYSPYI